ncbi:Transposase [Caenorhabditis elegans]|uniref:Transposase n=1 Tax=Caenorhabditis elegans TaxID=6239 RepID=E5QCG3_CAEEL|nr:Transposase [Caenorhabditis elegans]CBY24038.1 Transposase [Caenorhabditis elegans]|eukprot:NP_001254178.1 Uncharacterized protein CELE_C34C6.10 [Caenorhabditis elegans]
MVEKLALDTATFGSRFNDLLKVPCKTMKAWISSEADEPTTEIGPFTKEKLKNGYQQGQNGDVHHGAESLFLA